MRPQRSSMKSALKSGRWSESQSTGSSLRPFSTPSRVVQKMS
jgi:hypothetical protein